MLTNHSGPSASLFQPPIPSRTISVSDIATLDDISVIHRNVFHNEQLLPIEKVRLSPGQAGLISGWGLFTTMRIFRGEAFAYERHWRRLEKDAALIRLPMPYTAAKVRVNLHEVIRANHVSEGCARIYLVYNTYGFWHSDEPMPQVDLIIYTAPLPAYREPVRLGLREHARHAASPLAGVKTISWLQNVWAVAEAQKDGLDEVVLLNERGEVAECTAANIFAVKAGKIMTPPLNSGCLEGVTRGILFEITPEAGVSIVEQTLRPEDLYSADEVFISSTNRNLIGVGEIAGRPIATGPLAKRLDNLFEAYINEYVTRRLAAAR
jgi:branched-chain amino acid aminotransferase